MNSRFWLVAAFLLYGHAAAFAQTGSPGYALSFDGLDDYAVIPDNDELSGGGGRSITVEAWIYPFSIEGRGGIATKWLDHSSKDWGLAIDENGVIVVAIESDGDNFEYSGGNVPAGVWTHVAFTYDDNTNEVHMYIDGAESGAGAVQPNGMPDSDADIYIGKRGYRDDYFQGMIDDVRIWNVARTGAEIQSQVNSYLTGSESGLIGYWTFEDASGQSAADLSGNSNNFQLGTSSSGDASEPTWAALTSEPSISLTRPNGGESLEVGAPEAINWSSFGSFDTVDIEYSANGGNSWTSIVTATANDGSYDWQIPETPVTTALVRISKSGDLSVADTSDNTFSIVEQDIPQPPVITSFAPTSATWGSQVTISGSNFSGIISVKFRGTEAFFTVNSETEIIATVPDFAASGKIAVETALNTAVSATDFTVTESTVSGDTTLIEAETMSLNGYVIEDRDAGSGWSNDGIKVSGSSGTASFIFSGPADDYRFFVTYMDEADGNSSGSASINGSEIGTWEYSQQLDDFVTYQVSSSVQLSPGDEISIQTNRDSGEFGRVDYFQLVSLDGTPPDSGNVPVITSFAPESGEIGTEVTIDGEGFLDAIGISFNGVPATSFSIVSDVEMRALVPDGATTGKIAVTSNSGVGQSSTDFTVETDPGDPPTGTTLQLETETFFLSGFIIEEKNEPQFSGDVIKVSGSAGTATTSFPGATGRYQVSIRYLDEDDGVSNAAVRINGVEIDNWDLDLQLEDLTTRQLSADLEIGNGATVEISCNRDGGEFCRIDFMTFVSLDGGSGNAPLINSFTPSSGLAGTPVTISGESFTGANQVAFNGVAALSFSVDSDTQISTVVPDGATTGKITVTTAEGTGTSAGNFAVLLPLNFSDITLAAGTAGPLSNTGGHAALFTDVDNDGRPDLYITMLFESQMSDLLFMNGGSNVFSEEGNSRGVDDFDGGSHGAVFADLDNDGDYDLVNGTTGLLTEPPVPEQNDFYQNDGTGHFIDVTDETGIPFREWLTRGVTAFDMDNDGDLDVLTITNYEGSDDPSGERNELYRNDGGMHFTAINSGPIYVAPAGQGATASDYDGDGDMDVFAGNRTGDLNILRNNGGGNFSAVSPSSIGISHQGREGVSLGDIDNDGDLDMLLSDYDEAQSIALEHLYFNDDDGTFTFGRTFSNTVGYMGAFGDLDNDGDLDIVFAGDDRCYLNDGSGNFSVGPSIPVNGIDDPRAIAMADIDGDGDLDFAIGAKRSRNWLIRNNLNTGNWLKVKLVSPQGQAGASGAKVRIYGAGQAGGSLLMMREAQAANGYLGQSDPVQHFGLGGLSKVDVVIEFLDGTSTTRSNVDANQTLLVDASSPGIDAPVITSFMPDSAVHGSDIIILGSHFTGANQVSFNGVDSDDFTVDADGMITAQVPSSATSGKISVTTPNGTGVSAADFTLLPNSLSLVAPNGGGAFTVSATTQISWISVGDIANVALDYSLDDGSNWLVIQSSTANDGAFDWTVPDSPSATVLVRVSDVADAGVFDVSDSLFAIVSAPVAPVITSFSPDSGEVGTEVTVLGSGFTGTTSVSFGGTEATAFTVDSDGQITTNVPVGAVSGKIAVTTPAGTGQSAVDFKLIYTGEDVLIEAETMSLSSFVVEDKDDPIFSGDVIKVPGSTGTATIAFPGQTGHYRVLLRYIDEDDGTSNIKVTIDGNQIADFDLDEQLEALTTRELAADLEIQAGASIVITGQRDGGEFVRIDYIEFLALGGGEPEPPAITSFAPTSGGVGTTVTISGQNFTGATSVTFDGTDSDNFTISGANEITADVPASATSGKITVTTPAGSGVSATDFTVLPNSLSLVAPNGGGSFTVGATTQISWTSVGDITSVALDYSPDGGSNWLPVQSSTANDGAFDWTVPDSPSATVLVRVSDVADAGVFDVSDSLFAIVSAPVAPVITSFSPDSGEVGTEVTVLGSGFTGTTSVSFGGTNATAFTVDSDGQITTNVPAGAVSGKIAVTTPAGTGQSAGDFKLIYAGEDVLIEAETMILSSFVIEDRDDPIFSGDVIKVPGSSGTATIAFPGQTGRYRVLLRYVDEDDGTSNIKVTVDDNLIADFDLDEQLEALTTRELAAELEIQAGAPIVITGQRDGGEFVRIDYLEFLTLGGSTPTPPVISSFSPTSGVVGETVTIGGQNFAGATSVTFDGSEAAFSVNSDTEITADVPTGATSGKIGVTTPAGQATSAADFEVLTTGESLILEAEDMALSGYVIEERNGSDGYSGDNIKLSGSTGTASAAFSGATGQYRILMRYADEPDGIANIEVRVAGTLIADFDLDEQLNALKTRELSSNIQVQNSANIEITGRRDDGEFARVDYLEFAAVGSGGGQQLAITSFSPVNGDVGTAVTISGTGFTDATAVTFNGVSAGFSVESDSEILATVPAGATTGKIGVATAADNAESAGNFIVGTSDEITTLIFTPTDDAYLNVPQPGENHGSETGIRARLDKYESYLKYDVSGLTDNVLSARLRMVVSEGSEDGGSVYTVPNTYDGTSEPWLEEEINGTNAPVVSGSPIASVGAVSQDDTVEFDLSSVVTSNGVYSFAMLNGLSGDEVRYSSKEGRFAPQLIVEMLGISPLAPVIGSISPTTGDAGTEVTVTGSNLAILSGSNTFAGTIEIMPLGDSITKGVHGSTDNAGYRNDLAELLDAQVINYDFVGGENDGSGFDTDHEGHGGWRADEILAEIDGWVNTHRPNIVLLHIGTNDISSDETPETVRDEISAIIDVIHNFDPSTVTILASPVPRADAKDSINDALVALLDDLVTDKVLSGVYVRYAPIHEAFVTNASYATDYLADDVHPNDIGYTIMANVWFDLIRSVILENYDLTVAFNGLEAGEIGIDSEDQIRAVAPSGVTSGPLSVTTTYGSTESAADFSVIPGGSALALSVSFPRGGMIMTENSTHTIRWQSSGYIDNVNIEYSPDNGARWELIASSLPNEGRYVWQLPGELSDGYLIRVSDALNPNVKNTTEQPFAVSDYVSPDALPNILEMREAIFGRVQQNSDVLKRGDVDKDGDVDLFDFVNMLDLNSQRLQALARRPLQKASSDTEVWIDTPMVEGSGDSLVVPFYAESDKMARGFYIDLEYDSDEITIDENLPATNGDGMRLLWDISEDRIQVLGYLIKQDGAVQLRDAIGQILVNRRKGFEGSPYFEISSAQFASQSREPMAVSIAEAEVAELLPTEFSLSQNYPNPFNPETSIKFALPVKSKVELRIYNIKGELVRTLLDEERPAGGHAITWDGRNERSLRVASGIYIYRIKAGIFESSKRMTMLK